MGVFSQISQTYWILLLVWDEETLEDLTFLSCCYRHYDLDPMSLPADISGISVGKFTQISQIYWILLLVWDEEILKYLTFLFCC